MVNGMDFGTKMFGKKKVLDLTEKIGVANTFEEGRSPQGKLIGGGINPSIATASIGVASSSSLATNLKRTS